jgi:Type II secretion system (T2SS), protein M subtype b
MSGALTRLMNAPLWAQRLVAVVVVVVFFAAAAAAAAAMTASLDAKNEELQLLRDRAGRFARVVALEESLRAANGSADAGADASLFIEAESPAIARAALQGRITAMAGAHGVVVVSSGGLPDRTENGYQLIGLRADVTGEFNAVHSTVLDIESNLPPLFIRELGIKLAGGPGRGQPGPPQLTAQIQLYAAYRVPVSARTGGIQRAEAAQ